MFLKTLNARVQLYCVVMVSGKSLTMSIEFVTMTLHAAQSFVSACMPQCCRVVVPVGPCGQQCPQTEQQRGGNREMLQVRDCPQHNCLLTFATQRRHSGRL
jgi:hypothetical protein